MLIESDRHQTRIAILEKDRLTELFLERHQRVGVVGNIYKGKVNRVLPGMQAAFVDIGLERDAFLYVADVQGGEGAGRSGGTRERDSSEEGETEGEVTPVREPPPSIDTLLWRGQEILVQVLKDALPNKGARVSSHITLPGRHVVLLPGANHVGISRRIEDEEERERLHNVLDGLRPEGEGLILRTVGADSQVHELEADITLLEKLWASIQRRAESARAPTLIHRDLNLSLRVVRDFLNPDFHSLLVDSEEVHREVMDFLGEVQPSLQSLVRLDTVETSLMQRFGIDEEIEAALKNKVWLKSGGHIVIHQTEALVAVDVNTGRFVGHDNLQDTVLTTNLEAVREIVRQIRLRNLGGIIVLDLIDMQSPEHTDQVFLALTEELEKDRAKNKVLRISEFGLVELTRKRSRPSLERQLTESCPGCHGSGRIKSVDTVCLDLRRQLLQRRARLEGSEVTLRLNPDVAKALQTTEKEILDEVEQKLSARFLLYGDVEIPRHRFDIIDSWIEPDGQD